MPDRLRNRPGPTGYDDDVETLAAVVGAIREGGIQGGTPSPGESTTRWRRGLTPGHLSFAEGRLRDFLPGSTPRLREEVIRQVRNYLLQRREADELSRPYKFGRLTRFRRLR